MIGNITKVTIQGKCLNIAASARRSVNVKANEFVKKFGWGLAYDVSRCKSDEPLYCQVLDEELSLSDQEVLEIKRLVKSYLFIQERGGLENVKNLIATKLHWFDVGAIIKTNQAIADVESCQ